MSKLHGKIVTTVLIGKGSQLR